MSRQYFVQSFYEMMDIFDEKTTYAAVLAICPNSPLPIRACACCCCPWMPCCWPCLAGAVAVLIGLVCCCVGARAGAGAGAEGRLGAEPREERGILAFGID